MPTDVALNMHKETPLQDYFVRMKTTSVHHPKFAESIDILLNLLNSEQENLETRMAQYKGKNQDVANFVGYQRVRQMILEPSNYKILLKGIQSKNSGVLYAIHTILITIGDIQKEERI